MGVVDTKSFKCFMSHGEQAHQATPLSHRRRMANRQAGANLLLRWAQSAVTSTARLQVATPFWMRRLTCFELVIPPGSSRLPLMHPSQGAADPMSPWRRTPLSTARQPRPLAGLVESKRLALDAETNPRTRTSSHAVSTTSTERQLSQSSGLPTIVPNYRSRSPRSNVASLRT